LRRLAISALLFSTIMAGVPSKGLLAAPDEVAQPDPKKKAAATKLLAEGNRLSNDGQYVEALEKFRAAYDVYPSPKLLLNIGTMLRQLGRNVEAAEVYEKYLRDPGADPQQREFLTRTLDEINSLVGHLRVTVSPPDATVSLDGAPIEVPAAGTEVRVEPGTHKVAGEKKGLPPALVTVSVARGENREVVLKLSPTPIVVKSNPVVVAGIASLSVGVLGFIGAGITGGLVISANERYQQECPYRQCVNAAAYEAGKLGQTLLVVNAIAWGVGIAGAGAGTALLVIGTKKQKETHALTIGPGFISWQGRF
jgi:tetratricopeptide (TPR) repeat protein